MGGMWVPAPLICGRRLQHAMESGRAGMYGGLTGREEVNLTLTLFLDDLFLQALDGIHMSLLE